MKQGGKNQNIVYKKMHRVLAWPGSASKNTYIYEVGRSIIFHFLSLSLSHSLSLYGLYVVSVCTHEVTVLTAGEKCIKGKKEKCGCGMRLWQHRLTIFWVYFQLPRRQIVVMVGFWCVFSSTGQLLVCVHESRLCFPVLYYIVLSI